ncbi:outer membrane lipoprotein chaperone LolA [Psychrosphaera aquimarina]|uniref:Outer-membrane lipoprotein carrier protein n=1 Tax=Psychrosphaera aquimarina TaxID=2044854 RepID=A0ABU3QWW0_9GAMM|nr:outer membrane lipoprotein chaperone LolA [Psychrosphaera aquimarina]MDU0111917.1 outer membrane lipoprotein chaperone LolA [Psychrosphaera aquimarina]
MNISKLVTIFALISSFSLFAEPVETELRKLLVDYDGFTAEFKQQVKDTDNNVLHSASGQLVFKQPGQFIWEIVAPEQELLMSNGDTLWWFNPFLEQVSIFDAKDAVATTPFALLVSQQDEVWNKFTITKLESGFLVKPKNENNSQVSQLAIYFDDFLLKEIVITDRTQQTSSYELKKQAFKKKLNVNFNFDIPADIEIDDQRPVKTKPGK